MSWAGTILRIDLTTGKIAKEPTSKYIKDYIGGAVIGTRIFTEEVPPDTNAYDPKNMLTFNTGPLTGTLLGNKVLVASKAPQTANQLYTFVGMGGQIPSEIKFAGYDHIIITGKAKKPVYLYINNDDVEIRDAKHLWGLDTWETQTVLKKELQDPEVQIACIGPAGENLVVYALIMHEINNTASRKVGGVMGSKNLKAIAVRGTKGVKIADPKTFLALYDEFYNDISKGRGMPFAKMSHAEGISRQISEGYIYAYGAPIPDEAPHSPMIDFLKKCMVGPIGCAFCSLQCHQNFSVPGVGNGGTNCVNYFGLILQQMYDPTDFELFWEKTMLSNKLGIDNLAMEMVGNWLMELQKKGYITPEETDGIPMERRSRKAITSFVEKICRAEGFGRLFTEGIVPASKKIGKGHLEFADQYDNDFPYGWVEYAPDIGPVSKYRVAAVERVPGYADGYGNIPAYAEILGVSPKKAAEIIDGFACDSSERLTGDRNLWRTPRYNEKICKMVIEKEREVLLGDVTGHCEVQSAYLDHYGMQFNVDHYAKWMSADTGIQYTPDQLREASHKLRVMTDAYNALCTLTIGQEPLLARPAEELASFPVPGRPKDPEEIKRTQTDYCVTMGYDPETGIPTRQELERLGLHYLADKLEEVNKAPAKRKVKSHR